MFHNSETLNLVSNENTNKKKPAMYGKKWTKSEDERLLNYINNGIDIYTIAINHSRSVGGIKGRIYEFAYDMYVNNMSLEDIVQTMRVDKFTFDKFAFEKFIEKKQKIVQNKPVSNMHVPDKSIDSCLIYDKLSQLENLLKIMEENQNKMLNIINSLI